MVVISMVSKVLTTRCSNCSNDSDVIFNSIAFFSSSDFTIWKIFSIGFKSGERAGIDTSSHSTCSRPARATRLFCEGSLSITNNRLRLFFGPARANVTLTCCFMKSAKNCPFSFSYDCRSTTLCRRLLQPSCVTVCLRPNPSIPLL